MDLELELDKFLKIKTNGRDDTKANYLNFPYEPTPYKVLERLANSGYLSKKDKIIDYGAGKGRVDFYLAYQAKVKMVGVEYDKRLYQLALKNKEYAISATRVEFVNQNAKYFLPPVDATGAYFFNPFSITILKTVMNKLKEHKGFKLFFYYPSKTYLDYLNSCSFLKLRDRITYQDVFFTTDERECLLIYQIEI